MEYQVRDNAMESIKQNEGLRLKPYKCTEGYVTIGYGRNLETNGISQYEADMMLKNDLFHIEKRLKVQVGLAKHPDFVQEVLIEMAYQLGVDGLLMFTKTLEFIEQKDYQEAGKEMLKSDWAAQTPHRAKLLSEKMMFLF